MGFALPPATTAALAGGRSRLIYTSAGAASVGPASAGRASMLPAGSAASSLVVPADALAVGATLRLDGWGAIGAAAVAPGSFTFIPHVTAAGGTRVDLPGLVATPLIGVPGVCELVLVIQQTANGLLAGGRVRYGLENSASQYTLVINPEQLAVASDPGVARTFGIDGKWQLASAANFVTTQVATLSLMPVAP